jgi:nicotinamide phosphoribosyltransferase
LYNIFGGTVTDKGYKVLDGHVGAIYGDSITLPRAKEICERLMNMGFASTNWIAGVGSFTYQYNTRDTFSTAMKATYVEVAGEGREIFKKPVTDSGTKFSAKGLLNVSLDDNGEYKLTDCVSWEEEATGELKCVFENGVLLKDFTLSEIRQNIKM